MEITVKIITESGTYEMTGDSSDQFDGWQVQQNNAGYEGREIADAIADAVSERFVEMEDTRRVLDIYRAEAAGRKRA